MTASLHLTIATPACVLVDSQDIVALRAEDETGSFGILPGHTDFLTVLTPCVLRWHGADNVCHFCAVEEGVLRVSGGASVTIACRDGVLGDALDALKRRPGRPAHGASMCCARHASSKPVYTRKLFASCCVICARSPLVSMGGSTAVKVERSPHEPRSRRPGGPEPRR